MPSRVVPNESCVNDNLEDPTSVATQLSPTVSSLDDDQVNDEVLQAVEEAYKPLLRLMKFFGVYFGNTSLNNFMKASPRRRKESYISRFYCAVVVVGLWFDFVMPLISIFLGGDIYFLIMFVSWCLLVALMGTTFLIILPLTVTRKTRFENFLRKVIAIPIESAFLEKIKSKARVYLILFFPISVAAMVGTILTDVALGMNIGKLEPWNSWFGFRITSLFFLSFGSCIWILPLPFFCISCFILETLFDDLHKRMSLPHSNLVGIATLRREHQHLCQVVEMADSMLSPLLLEVFTFLIPVTCFNFYQTVNVNLRQEGTSAALVINLFWLLTSSAFLAVIMIAGSRVSEKVRNILQEKNILHFTLHLFGAANLYESCERRNILS